MDLGDAVNKAVGISVGECVTLLTNTGFALWTRPCTTAGGSLTEVCLNMLIEETIIHLDIQKIPTIM